MNLRALGNSNLPKAGFYFGYQQQERRLNNDPVILDPRISFIELVLDWNYSMFECVYQVFITRTPCHQWRRGSDYKNEQQDNRCTFQVAESDLEEGKPGPERTLVAGADTGTLLSS